jgi:hypothetical protein
LYHYKNQKWRKVIAEIGDKYELLDKKDNFPKVHLSLRISKRKLPESVVGILEKNSNEDDYFLKILQTQIEKEFANYNLFFNFHSKVVFFKNFIEYNHKKKKKFYIIDGETYTVDKYARVVFYYFISRGYIYSFSFISYDKKLEIFIPKMVKSIQLK